MWSMHFSPHIIVMIKRLIQGVSKFLESWYRCGSVEIVQRGNSLDLAGKFQCLLFKVYLINCNFSPVGCFLQKSTLLYYNTNRVSNTQNTLKKPIQIQNRTPCTSFWSSSVQSSFFLVSVWFLCLVCLIEHYYVITWTLFACLLLIEPGWSDFACLIQSQGYFVSCMSAISLKGF